MNRLSLALLENNFYIIIRNFFDLKANQKNTKDKARHVFMNPNYFSYIFLCAVKQTFFLMLLKSTLKTKKSSNEKWQIDHRRAVNDNIHKSNYVAHFKAILNFFY